MSKYDKSDLKKIAKAGGSISIPAKDFLMNDIINIADDLTSQGQLYIRDAEMLTNTEAIKISAKNPDKYYFTLTSFKLSFYILKHKDVFIFKLKNLIRTNIDTSEEALVIGNFALLYTRKRVKNTSGSTGFAWQNFSAKYKRVITSWCTVFKNAGIDTHFSANLYWDASGNFQLSCSAETDHSVEVFAIVEINQT